MELTDLQNHKTKLLQQRQGLLAQKALIQTDLDMLQGAIQSTDALIKEITPKE